VHKAQVIVTSHRIPSIRRSWRTPAGRVRLTPTPGLDDLSRVLYSHRVDIGVLDTSVRPAAGGFDAIDAALKLWRENDEGQRILLWTSDKVGSQHVAEEAARLYRDNGRPNQIAGAICSRGDCAIDAVIATLDGARWADEHLPRDFLDVRPVLFSELSAKNLVPAVLFAVAARPWASWGDLADLLGYSEATLRMDLRRRVRPALVRLGWIDDAQPLNRQNLVALAYERRDYIERYVDRYRTDYRYLFAA
jgi:hypothetical protein